jgi:hypothetical protein
MRTRPGAHWAWVALILGACALRLLWIGDVPFAVDGPKLLRHAAHMNAEARWAVNNGLPGYATPVSHGPLSVWIYQVALRLAANPMQIALWKAGVVTAVTVGSLYVLGVLLEGSPYTLLWFALLSPTLWASSRDLWDNSWGVPLSLLAWASYLTFDGRPSLARLSLVLVSLTTLFLTHLTSIPVVVAVSTHLLWMHRSWLWRHRVAVLALFLLCIGVTTPYTRYLWESRTLVVQTHQNPLSWLSWMLMFQPLTVFGLEGSLGDRWWSYPGFSGVATTILLVLRWLSLASGVFFFTGIGVAISNLRQGSAASETRVIRSADVLALMVLLAYGLLASIKGLGSFNSEYFNAMIPVALHFVWRGARFLAGFSVPRPRRQSLVWAGQGLLIGWAIALGTCLAAIQWRVHDGRGTRGLTWGPTLSNQWEIAQQLALLPTKPRFSRPERPAHFPDALDVVPLALDTLRVLVRPDQPSEGLPPNVEVNYRRPCDPWNGEIVFGIVPESPLGGGNP